MGFLNTMPSIPRLRPQYNVGCLFDIPTGTYYQGKHGEMILNGGLTKINSIAGPGNSFKTVISLYWNLSVAERYRGFELGAYDTENSLQYQRINKMTRKFPRLSQIDHADPEISDEDRVVTITSAAEVMGDEWFDSVKAIKEAKIKAGGAAYKTTPFINPDGSTIKDIIPTGLLIDSLSQFEVSALQEKIVDKHSVGESGQNMLWMKSGGAKKQMLTQMPNVSAKAGIKFTMVAHIGDEFELDPYAPKKHKLTHSKRGSKVTGTTKGFEFINDILIEIFGVSLLNNKPKGTGVVYPDGDLDRDPDSTDLLLVSAKYTRNKHGGSGIPLELVVSQREGLLPHLSQFHYVKTHDWGISGNAQTYALDLLPDVKLSRTTVRPKINADPELRRALEITSDMLQINTLWDDLGDDLMCTPAQLFNDINNLGYDWHQLLDTRGYWVFEEDAAGEKPYLSTLDLLRMRKGLYKPWWLEDKK